MRRFDLYTLIHKGLRRALFQTTLELAATDFGDEREGAAARAAFGRLAGFLAEHAAHEDMVIMPELALLAPELFIDLRAEHARLEGLEREIAELLERIQRSSAGERGSLGRRAVHRLGTFVATHLLHLEREEVDANRVLWAHLDDGQLLALQQRIVADVEPGRLAEWYALALPAANAQERRDALGAMRASLPAAAFEALTGAARAELGERNWNAALGKAVS